MSDILDHEYEPGSYIIRTRLLEEKLIEIFSYDKTSIVTRVLTAKGIFNETKMDGILCNILELDESQHDNLQAKKLDFEVDYETTHKVFSGCLKFFMSGFEDLELHYAIIKSVLK